MDRRVCVITTPVRSTVDRWRDASHRARCPSDLPGQQWGLVEPLLPPAKTGGRPEKHQRPFIVDAILHMVLLASAAEGLPAVGDGVLVLLPVGDAKVAEKILAAVSEQLGSPKPQPRARRGAGRLPDGEGVRDTVGRDNRGYDAGKKINGRKRFIATDTLGLLITVVVCAAKHAGPRRSRAGCCRRPAWSRRACSRPAQRRASGPTAGPGRTAVAGVRVEQSWRSEPKLSTCRADSAGVPLVATAGRSTARRGRRSCDGQRAALPPTATAPLHQRARRAPTPVPAVGAGSTGRDRRAFPGRRCTGRPRRQRRRAHRPPGRR